MADARKCDICGGYFDIVDGGINRFQMYHANNRGGTGKVTFIDACPKCVKAFNDLRESLKEDKPLKPTCPNIQLETVMLDGFVHFRASSNRKKQNCEVVVIRQIHDSTIHKICRIFTPGCELRLEEDHYYEDILDKNYQHFTIKESTYTWYSRRLDSDDWHVEPDILYIEYES